MTQDSSALADEPPKDRTSSQDPLSKTRRRNGLRQFLADMRVAVGGSLRANRIPALLSLFAGLGLVASYYAGGETTRPAFDALGELRTAGGIWFSTLSTGLFGGLLPVLLQAALGQLRRPYLAHGSFDIILWLVLGAAVDRLYAFQTFLFGDSPDAPTIVKKVLFDQFVWNPVLHPFTSMLFRWRDFDFPPLSSWGKGVLQPRGWLLTYCSFLVTIWGTWIPGTSVVYVFPSELQIPAFNVILFMFSILLGLISRQTSSDAEEDGEASQPEKVVDSAAPAGQVCQSSGASDALRDSAEVPLENEAPARMQIVLAV